MSSDREPKESPRQEARGRFPGPPLAPGKPSIRQVPYIRLLVETLRFQSGMDPMRRMLPHAPL